MKIVAITQARYGSSRLPGKILKEINGKSLLQIHLERILKSRLITKLVIATTIEPEADRIVAVGEKVGVTTYKGSIQNVLERFYLAAASENPDYVVRLTSDCPLIDATVIDQTINTCISNEVDYVSNTLITTFPDGLDVEVFRFSALEKAYKEATLNSDKEHVTPYIWRNSTLKGGSIFTSLNVASSADYSELRLTVDTQEDFMVIEQIINKTGDSNQWKEYVTFLENNPTIQDINNKNRRNEGYEKSLKND